MKVILDIDSKALEIIQKEGIINSENKITNVWVASEFMDALDNAVTLPDNATNGDVIKAMFPNVQVVDAGIHRITVIFGDCHNMMYRNSYDEDWWNAPYKGGQDNGNDN